MGMYTECVGYFKINCKDTKEKIQKLIDNYNDSPRASQCVFSTTIHYGFNGTTYLFIGGEIKNYDNDWIKYINFLEKNLDIIEGEMKTRYEEEDKFTIISVFNE